MSILTPSHPQAFLLQLTTSLCLWFWLDITVSSPFMSYDVAGLVLLHKLSKLLNLVYCHAFLIGDEVCTHHGHILQSCILVSLLQRQQCQIYIPFTCALSVTQMMGYTSAQYTLIPFIVLPILWTFFLYAAETLAPSISPKSSERLYWLFIWVYTQPYVVFTRKGKT